MGGIMRWVREYPIAFSVKLGVGFGSEAMVFENFVGKVFTEECGGEL